MRIALAGNPNSGKTSMYNMLTGRSEKVGNWAGVTVDKKENPIKKSYYDGEELIAVDLPGAYSMSPFTSEELAVGVAYLQRVGIVADGQVQVVGHLAAMIRPDLCADVLNVCCCFCHTTYVV